MSVPLLQSGGRSPENAYSSSGVRTSTLCHSPGFRRAHHDLPIDVRRFGHGGPKGLARLVAAPRPMPEPGTDTFLEQAVWESIVKTLAPAKQPTAKRLHLA